MKRYFTTILVLLAMVFMATAVHADTNLPPLKAGVGFSLVDNEINHLETLEFAKWKGISIEVGYAGDSNATDHKAVAVLSYELLKLKNYIELPVLDLIEFQPGVYVGVGGINGHRILESEFDWGISATILNLKF